MAGFSFNLGGITKGLSRGLQLEAQFNQLLVKAVKEGDQPTIERLASIAGQWLKEAGAEAGLFTQTQAVGLLLSPDPFSESRQMLQNLLSEKAPELTSHGS